MTITEVAAELTKALAESAKADEALQKAKIALAPLEEAAIEKHKVVNVLMGQYQNLTTDSSSGGRGGRRGPRKTYNITPEVKVVASGKRAYTRAINAGQSEKEAKKAQAAAEKLLAEKLGVK
jgi:hypothetical protein